MIVQLRRRFIRIAMVSVLLVMLLLSVSINLLNYISTDADLRQMLEMISENQGTLPQEGGGKLHEKRKEHIGPETPFSTRFFVLTYDAENGELIRADLGHIAAVTEEDAGDYLSTALSHGNGFGYTGNYRFYITQNQKGETMAVFLDCQRELQTLRSFGLVSLLVVTVCAGLVYLLVVLLSKRAIDPVVRSAERQKQFITDAGHELKTPLTVITTSLRVLEMEVGQQKWIDKAQAQADRMRDLVNDLVSLSRMDEERPTLEMSNFDLSTAVGETAESFQDFAAAQGRSLDIAITPNMHCNGNEYAIRQLVTILLDNAVKHSEGDGPIRLVLESCRRGIHLTVSNPCSPLDSTELERLFDRFYRTDKSHSKETGGFGVGLSIARGIAEAHKGSIQATCPDAGLICFTVRLR